MAIGRGSAKATKQKVISVVDTTTIGADMLDLAMGGGGGWGKVINIVGPEATAKTIIAAECVAQAKRKYGKELKFFWDDAERGFSFNAQELWGMDILPKDREDYSNTLEDWMYNVRKHIQKHIDSGKRFIYVMDSLDALTSDEEVQFAKERDTAREKGTKQKGSYKMGKAKLLSEFFRLLVGDIDGSNCLLIIISQVRMNVNSGPFGKKHTRAGGKALDLYACHIIEFKCIEKVKETHKGVKRVTGVTIHAYISKNKLWRPYRECVFKVLFDYGVDNIDSNVCFYFGLITEKMKTKKQIKVKWDDIKFSDRKALIKYIEDHNQEDKLRQKCKKKWDEIEDALSPSYRKSRW